METYMGWGCPTCEIGNPASRKRCKNCGRKRPEKLVLKIFNRAPRINKPKGRSKAMKKILKKAYGPQKKYDFVGTVTGRLSSKTASVSNIPKPLMPVETKLAARYSDGAMAELQTDGSVTCTCSEFAKTNGCSHKKGIEEFIRSHPLKTKES
jgi:hypothetical protein